MEVVTEREVARLVRDVLGESAVQVTPLTLTHSGNKIWDVRVATRSVIVRVRDDGRDQFAHTLANIAHLVTLGLPVPHCLAEDRSRTRYSFAYLILERMPGRDLLYELPQMSRPQITRLAGQMVSVQRAVARLPLGTGYGWGPIGGGGTESRWLFTLPSAVDTTPPPDDGTLRHRLYRQQVRFQPYFRQIAPICFLEDLTTKNVLLENGELSGLIDFDSVCFGDPLWMIGLTMGCIVCDLGPEYRFYTDELCRLWPVTPAQQQVVYWYAAQKALEFLTNVQTTGTRERSHRLEAAADEWLSRLEA